MKRYLGIDPSSSKVGIAIVEGHSLVMAVTRDVRGHAGKWEQSEIPDRLFEYMFWLRMLVKKTKPDAAACELLSVSHNMDTVRKIAYFEGASLIACSAEKVPCASVKSTTARKAVLGKGNLSKDECTPLLEKRAGRGLSGDEADAYLFALYAQGVKADTPGQV